MNDKTQVELDYEAGRWVPSWYGNTYASEQDLSFNVATLEEAQAEAARRNLVA